MDYLWAPWRIKYINKAREEEESCFLCSKPIRKNDAVDLILFRGQYCYVIMNSYPYNTGHLMVTPYRHFANLEDMNSKERNEQFKLISNSITVLKEVFKAEGFNIGMNLGRIAGAGIDKHIHAHVVPRWAGDTNFMPVVSEIKVVNEALEDTYKKLVGKF
jgi:ATP adenylyltransferase